MKVLLVNSVCGYGSTGKICTDLYDMLVERGHDCCIAYGRNTASEKYNTIKIGNKFDNYFHVLLTRLFDKHGFGSKNATKNFIKAIEEYDPDIIHLHNIHGYYVNIEVLFNYLKKSDKKIVWTLHDCWSITGHCASFLASECYKWKNKCNHCPLKKEYPKSLFDQSEKNWVIKKQLFTELGDKLTIIPVSDWLNEQIKKSYLSRYDILTIPNGIDTQVFKPEVSDFREKNSLVNKKIILGVSNVWNNLKGIDDFYKLANMLDDSYKIVLVGLSKNQLKALPTNIIGIVRTANQRELAKIYSTADIYINFSKAEAFGLTNYEAQACGTTTLSLDSGGTKETLVTPYAHLIKDVNDAYKFITGYNYTKTNNFKNIEIMDKRNAFRNYIELYERIMK